MREKKTKMVWNSHHWILLSYLSKDIFRWILFSCYVTSHQYQSPILHVIKSENITTNRLKCFETRNETVTINNLVKNVSTSVRLCSVFKTDDVGSWNYTDSHIKHGVVIWNQSFWTWPMTKEVVHTTYCWLIYMSSIKYEIITVP